MVTGDDTEISEIEGILKRTFTDRSLLITALTHSSYSNDQGHSENIDNERLEFLGDSVLKLAISELLFTKYPDFDEGTMTKIRAYIISDKTLAAEASSIGLGAYIRLSRSETRSGGSSRPSILANTLEAIFGAVYLDSGLESAKQLIYSTLKTPISNINSSSLFSVDYKSTLQEIMQKHNNSLPEYTVKEELGPDHDKTFVIEGRVLYSEKDITTLGRGKSKKTAEQNAARKLIEKVKDL